MEDQLDTAQQRSWPLVGAILALVIVGGAYLRLLGINAPLWVDELLVGWTLNGSWEDIAPRARMGNQSPVPHWLLWPYIKLVGQSEWTLRLPSYVASVASLPLVFWLAFRWTRSASAALVATVALAVEFYSMAIYASEARVYAIVQFLALAQLMAFETVLRTGDLRWRVASVLLAWMMFYMHYTSAMLFVAEGVAWLALRILILRKPLPYSLSGALLDCFVFLLGCLPAVQHVMHIGGLRNNWAMFIEVPTIQSLLEVIPHHAMAVVIVCLWCGIVVWREQTHQEAPLQRPAAHVVALALCWLLVPVLANWLLARFDIVRLFIPRYLVFAMPAMGVCLALLVASLPERRTRAALAGAAALVLVAWTIGRGYYGVIRAENWPAAIALLNERHWQPDEPLLFASNLIEAEMLKANEDNAELRAYCAHPIYSTYPLELDLSHVEPLTFREPGELLPKQKKRVLDWMADHDQIWLLVRGDEGRARAVARQVADSTGVVRGGKLHGFGLVWVVELNARR